MQMQPSFQKLAGIAAIALGGLFLGMIVIFSVVDHWLGLGLKEIRRPELALPILSKMPGLLSLYLLGIPFAGLLLVIALGIHERLRQVAPNLAAAAKALAIAFVALVMAADMIRIVGFNRVLDLYTIETDAAASLFVTVMSIADGLGLAAIMLLGFWQLVVGWIGLSAKRIGWWVCAAGMVAGIINIASIAHSSPLALLVDMVWFPLLGVAILRRCADATEMINPATLFDSRQYGFSQIAVTRGQKTVYMSGQVGWDENQRIVSAEDLRAQAWQAFENIEVGITAAGATLKDIVSLRIYIASKVMEQSQCVSEALMHFFPSDSPPTTTWIGVESLANSDLLVEIEPIAVIQEQH